MGFVDQIMLVAAMPDKLPAVQRSRDPRDDFPLALYEAGQADWLVTGDKDDLLALGQQGRTQIIPAARLLQKIERVHE